MGKLLILDGNSVLHRAYYALPDWRNRSGEATAGVYGFLSMMFKAIEELKPTHLVVVFDEPEPTFRHSMYVGYQTNREKDRQISEDIWGQVDKLKEALGKMGVTVRSLPGFEADDVVGTVARKYKEQKDQKANKNQIVIITGDRDLMQLVDERVNLYMPQKGLSDGAIVDETKVVERLGIKPSQVVDYKGLVGDSSDNYPGVAGIGPKTAVTLLEQYETLDNIYSNLDKIKEAIAMKLVSGHTAAMLSRQLAKIKTDCPVPVDLDKSLVPTEEKILEVLRDLGYKSLYKRISGEIMEEDRQGTLF